MMERVASYKDPMSCGKQQALALLGQVAARETLGHHSDDDHAAASGPGGRWKHAPRQMVGSGFPYREQMANAGAAHPNLEEHTEEAPHPAVSLSLRLRGRALSRASSSCRW